MKAAASKTKNKEWKLKSELLLFIFKQLKRTEFQTKKQHGVSRGLSNVDKTSIQLCHVRSEADVKEATR